MLIEHLDRTLWTLQQTEIHVRAQVASHLQADPERLTTALAPSEKWQPPRKLEDVVKLIAWEEIQVALRDGDLHAVGRVSTERAAAWVSEHDGWRFHSGRHSSIAPEHWRAGQPSTRTDALSLLDQHFIDIRMSRFMVLAIWPVTEVPKPALLPDPATGAPYRTPYMDMLDQAIAANRITRGDQGKKELLAEWFRSQQVEGEPVSQNLADAMATLIRLPSSQRGGAKRIF
ncbi:hypothetical protein [Falsiroseomonas selenitidurans]|uniref:Uncharacterized protein n=1 Tax=Falsiroseomonas selenitidurans TaxID=2716335 RepID=A0ABX1EAS3_9PROT|nr:hypothetical protein [Falsiroseomonas selenitidurans]NKC34291.1 hypothetical protein [Falsiroseomonas selenitidurans]